MLNTGRPTNVKGSEQCVQMCEYLCAMNVYCVNILQYSLLCYFREKEQK